MCDGLHPSGLFVKVDELGFFVILDHPSLTGAVICESSDPALKYKSIKMICRKLTHMARSCSRKVNQRTLDQMAVMLYSLIKSREY